jgi:hypothetical protein
MNHPKIQYRYGKLMEMVEDMVKKIMRFLQYDTFKQIKGIEPVDGKPVKDQEVLGEILKQLYTYAVRTAMVTR